MAAGLCELDFVAFRIADFEGAIAVLFYRDCFRDGDAFCGQILAQGFGVGADEGYAVEAVG